MAWQPWQKDVRFRNAWYSSSSKHDYCQFEEPFWQTADKICRCDSNGCILAVFWFHEVFHILGILLCRSSKVFPSVFPKAAFFRGKVLFPSFCSGYFRDFPCETGWDSHHELKWIHLCRPWRFLHFKPNKSDDIFECSKILRVLPGIARITAAFKHFDKDGSGVLEHQEICHGSSQLLHLWFDEIWLH